MGFGSSTFRLGPGNKDIGAKQAGWPPVGLLLKMHEVPPKVEVILEITSECASRPGRQKQTRRQMLSTETRA